MTYKDLTIDKYLKLRNLKDIEGNLETQVKMISILTDIDEEELLNLQLTKYQELVEETKFLLKEPKKTKINHIYKIGKYELEPIFDMKNVTTAQYIDFQTFVKDKDKYLVELLSCILIPKEKNYNDDYDIYDVQEQIRNYLSIEDALSITAFFLTLFQSLIKTTLTYSIKELKKAMKTMTQAEGKTIEEQITLLEQNGVG